MLMQGFNVKLLDLLVNIYYYGDYIFGNIVFKDMVLMYVVYVNFWVNQECVVCECD